MFFEHIVPIHSDLCIRISELREQSEESSEKMALYLEGYRHLVDKLRKSPMLRLNKQPLFVWHDRNSACWAFEEQRILHNYHRLLMKDAKACFTNCDYKGAKNYLGRAVDCCKEMLQSRWVWTPYVKGMPELQLPYVLSVLFRTKGTYCYNAHMFKTSPLVAKMAYNFVEIANCLWKKNQDKEYENKLKAHYHHSVASTSEDFKEIISHSKMAVELYNDPKMLEDHQLWNERNNTIHFETPEKVSVEVFSIETALKKV